MSNIDVVIAQNRGTLGIMGSTLGKQVFQVNPRESFPEFEKTKASVAAAGNQDLITNRTPMRYHIFGVDVHNVAVEENIAGQAVVLINKREDGTSDISIPISGDMNKFSNITKEAIKQAIKGDKTKVFANPKKLAAFLNEINNAEVTRIDALIEKLQKAKQGIITAISENNKKAEVFERELLESTPKVDLVENAAAEDGIQVDISKQ